MGSISIVTFESTDSEPCHDFVVKKRNRAKKTRFNQHAIELVHNPSWGFIDTDIGKLDTF